MIFACILVCQTGNIRAQPLEQEAKGVLKKRIYHTARASSAISIDGDLSDVAWKQVEWSADFTQRAPEDGGDPTLETAIKVLYDNKHLYVGIRCFDHEPDKIVKRMSRRDGFDGDWVEINIDSYHDLRSAFSFTASVSGVKGDEFITQDGGNWDTNWNPIWNFKTQIDSLGWTAEYAIPLSQLRFNNKDEQIWGMQFTRRDFRNDSRSNWQYNPQNSGYWVSAFGELHGIKGIKPKRQIEIQPFLLGQYTVSKAVPDDPYRDGSNSKITGGIDGKIGITNDLTLDFTANPDFGQVEADPAALNLDGFEIFFEERRPFFVENRNTFNYNISNSNAGGAYDSDNLFYSRRIGASPHRKVFGSGSEDFFVDAPDFTSILGAAKFSGKTNKGLTIGILESVTQKEYAKVSKAGVENKEVVEPLTNYSVIRFQQDFNEGNTVLGVIGTGVHRNIDHQSLEYLHDAAYSGGLDLLHQWDNKKWRLNASLVTSHVKGTVAAITQTQRSFTHGFNRPDADHLSVDENATSLTGTGGNLNIGQYGKRIQFQVGATYRSPGLELNDLGFLRNADEINQYLWAGFRWSRPFAIFRDFRVNFNEWSRWDFGGRHLYQAFNVNMNTTFKNFWSSGLGLNFETNDISNTWLRSGPAFRKPHGYGGSFNVGTDSRKDIQLSMNTNGGAGYDNSVNSYTVGVTLRMQLSNAINASIGSSWNRNFREDQYVTTQSSNNETRYILGEIVQKTLDFTIRINYNITPDLTIQYYGQPFISRGIYSDFKYVTDALANKVKNRYRSYTEDQLKIEQGLEFYSIDENLDANIDYQVLNPNFDFVQFRSNLVARWEYKPGSEIFLVWSQGSTAFRRDIDVTIPRSLNENLWDDSLTNTFLIKLTYRLTN
jgi:hypothetical protein